MFPTARTIFPASARISVQVAKLAIAEIEVRGNRCPGSEGQTR